MSFVKENVAYRTKRKMGCKKQNAVQEKNGQQLGSEKNKKIGVKIKSTITWDIREIKCSISKLEYFSNDSPQKL